MTTIQKINKLNKECGFSLGIQCYDFGNRTTWQISAFREESPLAIKNKYPFIEGQTVKEVVDRAYQFVFESKL
jgi:hypothetical protein